MHMTKKRPNAPGWYWFELPGHWALQPALVFDGGSHHGLMYTFEKIDLFEDNLDRGGKYLSECNPNALWSTDPIIPPDRLERSA